MLDEEKIKSIIPTSQDLILVFFFKKIQFQLYSDILNNISIKTDRLINLLFRGTSQMPCKPLVGNKHDIELL